jgi:integrase
MHGRQRKHFSCSSTMKLHALRWKLRRSGLFSIDIWRMSCQSDTPPGVRICRTFGNTFDRAGGDQPVNKLKPMAMEQWLRDLPLAPKSKVHIRSLMHLVLKCAERWGIIEIGKNPVTLVRVKNASKRLKRPQILEVGQFFEMLQHLAEPYRTMVIVAQCTGLRISELSGWADRRGQDGILERLCSPRLPS